MGDQLEKQFGYFSPSMRYRATLAQEVRCAGVGVHSGKKTSLIFKPAPFGQGIKCEGAGELNMHWRYVSDTNLATTLKFPQGKKVSMVEHMMAACRGFGVTDLTIEIEGSECPIFDGSSKDYLQCLMKGGRKESTEETSWIVLKAPLSLTKGRGSMCLTPGEPLLDVTVTLEENFSQRHCFHPLLHSFAQDIGPARTFARLSDVQALRKAGYIKGGSLASAVVLHEGRVVNQGGFRLPNECARHKILDILGDFALMGHYFYGTLSAVNPSHTLNHLMVLKLMANPQAFEILPFSRLPMFPMTRSAMPL